MRILTLFLAMIASVYSVDDGWPGSDDKPYYSIRQCPRDEFVKKLADDTKLTEIDKKAITECIKDGGYTHCSVSLFVINGKTVMMVDQSIPRKELGVDTDGHKLVSGGLGTAELFRKIGDVWDLYSVYHYD